MIFDDRDVQQAECALRCATILGCFLARAGVREVFARSPEPLGDLNNKLNTVLLLVDKIKRRSTELEREALDALPE